jgi:two-component system, NtrC family, nitrogen regulation sensor histidine kinase NtrY
LKILFFKNVFFRDNVYLLLTSLLLLSVAVFTTQKNTKESLEKSYNKTLQQQVNKAQINFNKFAADKTIFKDSSGEVNAYEPYINDKSQYYFAYLEKDSLALKFWSTQLILPDTATIDGKSATAIQLQNGYYFMQQKRSDSFLLVSLMPIKWNYPITNDYLKNEFTIKPELGKNLEISLDTSIAKVKTEDGQPLFSAVIKSTFDKYDNNKLTAWLRILAIIPLLIFIHFLSLYVLDNFGFIKAFIVLVGSIFIVRYSTYLFVDIIGFNLFELFSPTVYGSSYVLKSLGDLFINVLLILWEILFLKNNINKFEGFKNLSKKANIWILMALGALALLAYTYTFVFVIRSLVRDSQISFDVSDFFSLNIYSIIGFLILSCLALGYYYFSRSILFYLRKVYPNYKIPFTLFCTIGGLAYLTFNVGAITNMLELFVLIWLLAYIQLLRTDVMGVLEAKPLVSKMVFWLFLFSVSISIILIYENQEKELNKSLNYAEVISSKTDPLNDFVLNSILTDFREDNLSSKFANLTTANFANSFKDSVIDNNLSSFTDNYNTKILIYDSQEKPLFNEDAVTYNVLNSIYQTQAKPTTVAGMFFYDTGFDSYNYVAKRVVKTTTDSLQGYVFLVINPKKFATQDLYPELFGRGITNSIDNSSKYAYATYKNKQLVNSVNEYPFATKLDSLAFSGNNYIIEKRNNYSLLWYNAGSNKIILITKKSNIWLEAITLFSYLFCAFILLNSIFSFANILLLSKFKIENIKNAFQLSLRSQVQNTIIFFSIISFAIIALVTILFFISTAEKNNKETLSKVTEIVKKDFNKNLNRSLINQSSFFNTITPSDSLLQDAVIKAAEVHAVEINLYDVLGNLKASSLALPYSKGILSKKINPNAYFHLSEAKEIHYFQNESIGDLKFVSNYAPLVDSANKEMGYLNIPYFTSANKLKDEISNFLITVIIINAFILLLSGIVALLITNRITNSFALISEKMKQINVSKTNEVIVWDRRDEIGDLVNEYNKMVAKLDDSIATLAKTERENAWQEMAKQVAHEIKNPLTPMKLSMQFLQKSIEEGAPNIKQLSNKVSGTLVEQIDHLSNIADEFSRFANIENAKPEIFNVGNLLHSINQLYQADEKVQFHDVIIPNEVLVYADKTHVNRILNNLILNGIQSVSEAFTPTISMVQSVIDKEVIIEIIDNGAGISDDVVDKIFSPNFTTKSSGTGLGLAMCKRMIEQAGGTITFTTGNLGTIFKVTLPIYKAA